MLGHPLSTSSFTLWIPSIVEAAIVVQGFSWPTEEMQSIKVTQRGQEIELPTKTKVSGDWTFTIPENAFGLIRHQLLQLLYNKNTFNVTQILGNALDALNVGSWQGALQGIANLAQEAAALLLSAQVLEGCWVRSISPSEFASDDPTKPVVWSVTLHYNSIRMLYA